MSLLGAFRSMETVHVAACGHLLDTLGMPETEYQAFLRYKEMKGMGQVVTWSVRDETLHTISASRLFHAFIEENAELRTDTCRLPAPPQSTMRTRP